LSYVNLHFVTECSDFAKISGLPAEPSPVSDPEGSQDYSNHLHQLMSAGDVSGVRLVHFGANLP